jgi:LysM repeat protein
MRRAIPTLFISLFLIIQAAIPVAAQDNLLTNGGLEEGEFGPYSGRGRGDLTIPAGWGIWLGQGEISDTNFLNRGDKVFSFPHRGPGPDPVEGSLAMNWSGGFVQFNAAAYQTIGMAAGTNVRAEAASQIKACNLNGGSFCGSDVNSGAQTRIGIDPDGGTNPNAPEIVWSAWLRPHDRWDRQAVEATATGTEITVFIFATQDQPYEANQVWWDDVKLTAEGGGGAAPQGEGDSGGEGIAPPPPPPNFVPFVNPQGAQEDGSIVHTVAEGDTLDSIAVAYGLTRDDLIERNPDLGSIRFLQIGQRIVIQEATAPEPTATAAAVEEEIASTPIPGGVAPTEEVAAPPPDDTTPEDESDDDVVINADPKGLETDGIDEADTAAMLDFMDSLFGGGDSQNVTSADNTEDESATDEMSDEDMAEDTDGDMSEDEEMSEDEMTEEANADGMEEATEVADAGDTMAEPTEEGDTEDTMVEPTEQDDMSDEDMSEPTDEPEPTPVPTEAPTAVAEAPPVVEPESLPQIDVASASVAVCVSLFEDINQNRLREDGEALLAGGTINITQDGAEAASYETDGASEPHCFTDLSIGEYVAVVQPPAGFGLTTPNQLRLPLTSGAALNIEFGAAEGLEVAELPPPDAADLGDSADEVLPATTPSLTDNLMAISGIIVAALAGIVVVAGIGAAVLIRRAR